MPQVVIIAVIEIAAYYGAITTAAAIMAEIAVIYGAIQKRRAERKAKEAYNASLKDRLVTMATIDGYRSRVYGRVRNVDGVLFKATRGDKNQFYTLVIALAGHECDAIETVYVGDTPVELDGNGYVLTPPWNGTKADGVGGWRTPRISAQADIALTAGSGSVTLPEVPDGDVVVMVNGQSYTPVVVGGLVTVTGAGGYTGTGKVTYQFRAGSSSATKARVRKYLGAPGQDLSVVLAPLFPGLITAGVHRFEGVCCLLVDLEYDQDAFPTGVPQITAVVRGAKVLDPRTSVTAWTQNPALIARDWSLYAQGGGAQADELVAASFTEAANACDVSHDFSSTNAAGTVVVTTRPMYTCGIVCRTEASPLDTLSAIVESMAGQWAWTGGQLRVRAGAYSAPVATLTEAWCGGQGDIELVSSVARTELVNVITPVIADAAQKYVPLPIPRVPAPAYIEADGGELPRELELEGVTDADHAQHISGVMLREQRQGLSGVIPCNLRAYPIEVFDTIALDLPRFGFVGKTVQVLGWQFSQKGGVVLSWRETDASIYDPAAGFTRSDPAPNTALPSPFVVPPVSLNAPASGTAQLLRQADGTIVSRVLVSWDAVEDEAVRNGGAIEVRYGLASTDPSLWQTVTAPGSDTQLYLNSVQDGGVYIISARARNKLVAGDWSGHVAHFVLGKTEAPAAVAGLSLSVVPGALKGTRTPSTELDYARTLYRYGASFAGGTPVPGTSDERGFVWPWPALGSYTIWAADVDTSGIVGPAVSAGITVGSSLLIGGDNADIAIPYGAINADPGLLNPAAAWQWDAPITVLGPSTAAGALGVKFFSEETGAVNRFVRTRQTFPISATRTYNLSALLYAAVGNNRYMFLVVDMYKADGTQLTGADTGWGGSFAGYTYGSLPAVGQFTRYGADFGAGTPRPIPAAAAYFRIAVWFQYSEIGSSSVQQAAEDIRVVDVTEARAALDAANAAAEDAAEAIIAAADAQATADGKVTTFVQNSPPTAEGVGDLWIDTDDSNKLYRWNASVWAEIRDTGIGQALANASNAQATADGKIVTFYQTGAPTASAVGDLWVDTDDANKLYRWSGSIWVSIRDAGITAALSAAAAAQSTADGKIDTYFQSSAPTGSDGDIWFNTSDSNKQYVKVGGTWVLAADARIGDALTAAAGAQATADGKVTTFFAASAPTAEGVGDLWFNTTDGRVKRWDGSSWATQSVIGAGDVGTGNLADQAATEVYVQEFAFYTLAASDTAPFSLFTQALAAGVFEITLSARVRVNPSAGANNFRLLMTPSGTMTVYGRPSAELQCSAVTGPQTITAAIVVECTGSGPWSIALTTDFEFFNGGPGFGASALVDDTSMRATRVKK